MFYIAYAVHEFSAVNEKSCVQGLCSGNLMVSSSDRSHLRLCFFDDEAVNLEPIDNVEVMEFGAINCIYKVHQTVRNGCVVEIRAYVIDTMTCYVIVLKKFLLLHRDFFDFGFHDLWIVWSIIYNNIPRCRFLRKDEVLINIASRHKICTQCTHELFRGEVIIHWATHGYTLKSISIDVKICNDSLLIISVLLFEPVPAYR